eukprot:1099838-Alexandrium_andersonii.AAC.1
MCIRDRVCVCVPACLGRRHAGNTGATVAAAAAAAAAAAPEHRPAGDIKELLLLNTELLLLNTELLLLLLLFLNTEACWQY